MAVLITLSGSGVWEMSLIFGTAAYLLPMLFCLEVYGITAGALNTAQGCAIEAQESFAAARAAQFAFNHVHVPFITQKIELQDLSV